MEITIESLSWIALVVVPLFGFPFIPLILVPWAVYVGWFFWRQFVSQDIISPEGKGIYVTGCDTGFGHEVALLLDSKGFHVFAGCLKPTGEGAKFLKAQASNRLMVIDLDVADMEKVKKTAEVIKTECGRRGIVLWGLYNNAGIASAGEIEWTSLNDFQKLLSVNLLGAVAVTKSVLPLIRRCQGRVVTITSGLARMPFLGRSAYSMSKAGLESFMACLRYEMRKFGVKCSIIYPGNLVAATQVFAGLSRHMDQICKEMDPEVKSDYGDQYIDRFRQTVVGNYSAAGTTTTAPVVKAVCHALTSEYPRIRYKPFDVSWMIYDFLMQHLPEELSDLIIAFLVRLPKPAACPG